MSRWWRDRLPLPFLGRRSMVGKDGLNIAFYWRRMGSRRLLVLIMAMYWGRVWVQELSTPTTL